MEEWRVAGLWSRGSISSFHTYRSHYPNLVMKSTDRNLNPELKTTRHQFFLAESNPPSPKSNMDEALLIIA